MTPLGQGTDHPKFMKLYEWLPCSDMNRLGNYASFEQVKTSQNIMYKHVFWCIYDIYHL